MNEPPKVKYKGLFNFNKDNVYNCNNIHEAEEDFYQLLKEARREQDTFKKISKTESAFTMLGKYITLEYFNEVLDYVEVSKEGIFKWLNFWLWKGKSDWAIVNFEWRWFFKLIGRDDLILPEETKEQRKKRIEQIKKEIQEAEKEKKE